MHESRRARYESMSRGDLINALVALDGPSPAEREELARLRAAERAVAGERDRFLDLFREAPIPYVVLDQKATVLAANVAAAMLFQRAADALVGVPLTHIMSFVEKQPFEDHVTRSFFERKRASVDLHVRMRGRDAWLRMATTPLGDEEDVLCGATFADITRSRQERDELRYLAEADEEVAAAMDLRSTLAAIVRAYRPRLADVCFVDLLADDGTLERVETGGASAQVRAALRRHAASDPWQRYGRRLLETLTPIYEPTSAGALGGECEKTIGACAVVVVPLVAGGRGTGLVGAVMGPSGRGYALADFELAQEIARPAAYALEKAMALERARNAVAACEQMRGMLTPDFTSALDSLIAGMGTTEAANARNALKDLSCVWLRAPRAEEQSDGGDG